jgi:hypothetical protein
MNKWQPVLFFTTCMALAGCGGGEASDAPMPPASIGGTVSGLPTGRSLLLTNNGAETIRITENGSFVFGTRMAEGANYNVSITGYPGVGYCFLHNGSGTIARGVENISNIEISCVPYWPL